MRTLTEFVEEADYCLIRMDDGKANALSFEMLGQLNAALDRAAQAGKVVVLAGRPGKFCAGFDLSVMGQGGEAMIDLLRTGAALSRRLLAMETPVVLAVSGHALAMGALLLLSADYRIGIRGDYRIGLNEVAIGMTLPYFGVELARARLVPSHLERAVNLAELYDPAGAVAAGYLDEAVSGEELLARASARAAQLARLDMEAHRDTKIRIREQLNGAMAAALARDFPAG
jgi:enoyl-CoA hydratase